jgi:hypothetical protein
VWRHSWSVIRFRPARSHAFSAWAAILSDMTERPTTVPSCGLRWRLHTSSRIGRTLSAIGGRCRRRLISAREGDRGLGRRGPFSLGSPGGDVVVIKRCRAGGADRVPGTYERGLQDRSGLFAARGGDTLRVAGLAEGAQKLGLSFMGGPDADREATSR